MSTNTFRDQYYADGWWSKETLADALNRSAVADPSRVLIIDGQTRLDCATLHARATALAGTLVARLPARSVVSFMLPNWHEAAVIYLGATLAGMVVNPILPSLREHELRFMLDDVCTRMIFVPNEFRGHDYPAMLQAVRAVLPDPPEVVVLRGTDHQRFEAMCSPSTPSITVELPQLRADDVQLILYTSGSTGAPKGVLHSHNSLRALIRQLGEHWQINPGDTFLVPSPIAHIGGSIYAFECPLLLGSTAVLTERWEPHGALDLMTEHRCTHMAGATPFLTQLLDAARARHTRLPDLKVFICGGASVPPSVIRSASAYFEKAMVTRVYGSSEVPVTTVGAISAGDVDHAADTDGKPGIADVIIVDDEIRSRGPQMMLGYLHPGDTAAAFDDDGYFRTGDLGRWVDQDYLLVTGRAKDLIIRNGENISPKEIEDILVAEPGIAEIAIVGLPDARTGERACAVIVPDGHTPDLDELSQILQQRGVAKFKIPEQLEIWDALPKNDAGKVLKHRIRALLTSQ